MPFVTRDDVMLWVRNGCVYEKILNHSQFEIQTHGTHGTCEIVVNLPSWYTQYVSRESSGELQKLIADQLLLSFTPHKASQVLFRQIQPPSFEGLHVIKNGI